MTLTFTDPPRDPRIGKWSYDWTLVRRGLMERPGEWALLDEAKARRSVANALRDDKITTMTRNDGIEITVSGTDLTVKPNVCFIYLRYVPENDINNTENTESKENA